MKILNWMDFELDVQVYVKAKECVDRVSAEEFAITLAKHFTSFYHQASF